MIAGAVAFLRGVTSTLSPKGWLVVTVVVVLGFLATGWWCSDRRADRLVREEARREADLLRRDDEADERAADERLTDDRNNRAAEERLEDAIEGIPDSLPSAHRLALACERLRRQGTAPLPAACRSAG